MSKKVRVAIVGLGFGAEFIPIYQAHPNAEMVRHLPAEQGRTRQVRRQLRHQEALHELRRPAQGPRHRRRPHQQPDPRPRAAKPGRTEGRQARRLHGADGRRRSTNSSSSCDAQRKSGKVYMMMETVVYSREYLFVKELYDKGELGRIQFLRGSHQQDMDGWPDYWPGLPPMWYATHCVSPCLAILGKLADSVVCHGSGRIREELIKKYNSPFAIETATFKIKGSDVVAEVTRSLFDMARQYRESFDVTGSKKSFEWQQVEGRRAGHPHDQEAGAGDSPTSRRCRTTRTCCRSRSASSRSRRHPGRGAPVVRARRRPRRQPSAPGQQLPDGGAGRAAGVARLRRPAPTGRRSASVPIRAR